MAIYSSIPVKPDLRFRFCSGILPAVVKVQGALGKCLTLSLYTRHLGSSHHGSEGAMPEIPEVPPRQNVSLSLL
jgi:hypothetical protein